MSVVPFEIKMVELEFPQFSDEEKKGFREEFKKYDTTNDQKLQTFELHRMYESQGQTKTNDQLLALCREANPSVSNATYIDYKGFLTILLKEKKGILSTSFGLMGLVGKVHDNKKDVGRKANVFEQMAIKEKEEELRRQHDDEERRAKRKEAERKKRVQANLARFKSNINK
mmetsp:Transcript_11092/g.12199  ORF Transcript_11092/g.12199 Transcript_11092/m.12199 type:complete len:171 (+) Transcript_11092:13-525(+)